jgi:hypothetical protein
LASKFGATRMRCPAALERMRRRPRQLDHDSGGWPELTQEQSTLRPVTPHSRAGPLLRNPPGSPRRAGASPMLERWPAPRDVQGHV